MNTIHKIRQRVGGVALAFLFAAAASAAEPVQTERTRDLLELKAREGKTTLAQLDAKGGLDDLLLGLDFFSRCDERRNPLPISASDFLLYNAKHIGGMLNKLEKSKGVPAAGLIAKVKLYETINQLKPLLTQGTPDQLMANRERARAVLMSLTVNEFLEALPIEIRHYDRVARIACDLIGPEHNAGKSEAPRINIQGFAFTKVKELWQQAFLTSSPATKTGQKASAIHIYPDNTLFNAPEEYVDDTIAALISHELVHGYQHQVNDVTLENCDAGASVISRRQRTHTTRLQLDADAWRLYEQRRDKDLKQRSRMRAATGAAVGGGVGYLTGRFLGAKRGLPRVLAAGSGAAAGALYLGPAKPVRSLRDLPSVEYEADVEGVVLACQRGYRVEGFRHLFTNMESGPGSVPFEPSASQREVIAAIDFKAEATNFEESKCQYHPDTRLRYVNLVATAKALCPAQSRAPQAVASGTSPTQVAKAKVPSASTGGGGAAPVVRKVPRTVPADTVSTRLSQFRERCLNSDECMRMIVANAPTLIQTSGQVPEQALGGTALPPAPSPKQGAAPAKVTLSNQYCAIDKMAGQWKGRYEQGGALVPFDLVLSVASGALTGESTEPDTRPGHSGSVTARWAGVLSAQGMVFERNYVVAPDVVSHYYGYCNKENTAISGEWRLGNLRGEFELLKQ